MGPAWACETQTWEWSVGASAQNGVQLRHLEAGYEGERERAGGSPGRGRPIPSCNARRPLVVVKSARKSNIDGSYLVKRGTRRSDQVSTFLDNEKYPASAFFEEEALVQTYYSSTYII
jgi:hypothetical protein